MKKIRHLLLLIYQYVLNKIRVLEKAIPFSSWFHKSFYLLKFSIKHFNFLKFMISSSKRKKEIPRLDYKDSSGKAHKLPMEVNLYLTKNCNMQCMMCPYYGEAALQRNLNGKYEYKETLTLSEYEKLVDQLKEQSTFFYLSGGEPLLYPYSIKELIILLKRKSNRVSMNTNGYLLEKHAASLVESGLDFIIVSIDGPEAIHNKIRGKDDSFQRAVAGVKKLHTVKKKYKVKHPVVSALWTINKDNYSYLHKLPELYNDLGFDMAGITFLCFTDLERGQKTAEIKKQLFKETSSAWKGNLINTKDINLNVLEAEYTKVLRAKKKFLFYTMPAGLKPSQIYSYYNDLDNTFGIESCFKAWYRVHIRSNGDATTCEFFSPSVMGNITKQTLAKIWNNENYKKYRNYLQQQGYFPYCTRCTEFYPP